MDHNITKDELLESIKRSGYLLESKVIKKLNDAYFFVEPNEVIKDKNTGKDREIDIIAETREISTRESNIFVNSKFIIEVKNNLSPFVLLTKRSWTPHLAEDAYLQYIVTPTENNPFLHNIGLHELRGEYDIITYSQYCSFTKKSSKNELMASHPNELHSTFLKLADCCQNNMKRWDSCKDQYWRLWFYVPILVLKDNLYVLKTSNEIDLIKTNHARLAFNCHFDQEQKSIGINIVTENYLLKFMQDIVNNDMKIEDKLFEFYKSINKITN